MNVDQQSRGVFDRRFGVVTCVVGQLEQDVLVFAHASLPLGG
ncbi:hypothetical protein [Rosistilla oblonga]